jgi:hypothetical protein
MKTSLALLFVFSGLFCLTASAANQPNVVFIMADDLGNADLGYPEDRTEGPPPSL